MSHTVNVLLIADQTITLHGQEMNIHDIFAIYLDSEGVITDVAMKNDIVASQDVNLSKG